jgi:ABC-type glycerol-3-phosphate transport system permease component
MSVEKIRLMFLYLLLVIFMLWFIFPLYWAVLAALKEPGEIFTNPWGFPSKPTLNNLVNAWILGGFAGAYINSGILTISTTITIIVLSAMISYPLSRFNFRLRDAIFYFIVAGYMIPPIAILIPLYFMLKSMNLIDNLLGIYLAYIGLNLPIPVLIMRSYMNTIPRALDESALVDGASSWYIFWKIIFPLSKPAIAAVGIWTALITWQDFLYALTLLLQPENFTVPRAILNFYGSYYNAWGYIAAGFIFAIIPIEIIYLLFQKQFVKGLTAGAIKG